MLGRMEGGVGRYSRSSLGDDIELLGNGSEVNLASIRELDAGKQELELGVCIERHLVGVALMCYYELVLQSSLANGKGRGKRGRATRAVPNLWTLMVAEQPSEAAADSRVN